jgi:hypothetical protein
VKIFFVLTRIPEQLEQEASLRGDLNLGNDPMGDKVPSSCTQSRQQGLGKQPTSVTEAAGTAL